jgi:DNA-binding SARP family transcriptional activator/tetratricopeptide (TPR) repeat protein
MADSHVPAAQSTTAIRFAVLGPLAVVDSGAQIALSSPVHRVLLAVLLLNANKPVSASELTEAIWDGAPPVTAKTSLQNHVMRLRRVLGTTVGRRLVTRAPGYLIEVRDGELDVNSFDKLRDSGRSAARRGAWLDAAGSLLAALNLWTGEPLANVRACGLLAAEAQRLTELRLQTMELRLEAELRGGQHADVIGELRSLTVAHPLRERFRELLMMALYRDGRQAEALAAYRDMRTTLVDEFGIEPGARLQRLHQQILAADPALAAGLEAPDPAAANPAAPEHPPGEEVVAAGRPLVLVVPRQLPSAVRPFVGRQAELGQLERWLEGAVDTGLPLIVAISGTAGVGKTALAVHWARRASGQFPGGQLYLDLRGFAPSGQPAEPAEAIRWLLDGLGAPAERIPASGQAQVGLYRSLLADREPVLVLLDNARDASQVRPLLPGAPGCLAIVTSRDDLAGLSALDGARPLALEVLSEPGARELLASRLGADLVAAQPDAVDELCSLCARLPLALAIAAARATLPSGPSLARLINELRDTSGRLDALDAGDQPSSIRAVLSWSYRRLSKQAARMFRLLGVQHGPDVNVCAAASLAGVPADEARRLLTELARAQLLTRRPLARFGFHDLLRAYAAERAAAEEGTAARQAALSRLLDYYLHTADAAEGLLYPTRDKPELGPVAEGVSPERLARPAHAAAWFEAEHQGVLAAVFQDGAAGFGARVWKLAWVLSGFLERRAHWADLARAQRTALAVASDLGDVPGLARAHRALGVALIRLNDLSGAREHLTAASAGYARAGDQVGQARVSVDLGMLAELRGDVPAALAHAERALSLFTTVSHRAGQGRALNAVGWHHAQLGDVRRALTPCQQAVELCAELGDRLGEAAAWDSLAYCHGKLGDYRAAIACCQRAIELTVLVGDRYHQAIALDRAGDVHETAQDHVQARAAWQQAATILDELGHPDATQVRGKLAG